MNIRWGFTLIEFIVVIIIIGILATIAVTHYGGAMEKTLDSEAVSTLKVLQAAENSYHLNNNAYYASSVAQDISNNLGVSLPATTNTKWNYAVFASGCVMATRNLAAPKNRKWCLTINDSDGEPDNGCNCS